MIENKSNELRKRAKTFFWASLFFSFSQRKHIQVLYSFCRYIDDISDSNSYSKYEAYKLLDEVKKDLINLKSDNIVIQNFINLKKEKEIDINLPTELISGVQKDLNNVNFNNIKDLLVYSYQVAGTVGLMMCAIMKVKNKTLLNHAVELGVAMQLTNISRDIKEDLLRNRIYLPKSMRNFSYNNYNELMNNEKKKKIFSYDVVKLIDYSNELYLCARNGINRLPRKYKLPILISSKLYQQIGYEIRNNPEDLWCKRFYVSYIKKIVITFLCVFDFSLTIFSYPKKKNTHKELANILGKYLNINGK